jgi:hypothetical protein
MPQIGVLAQYVKDLSFENPNAPRSLTPTGQQPTLNVQVHVDAKPASETDVEVSLRLEGKAESQGTLLFDFGKESLVLEELIIEAVNRKRFRRHAALRVDIAMERLDHSLRFFQHCGPTSKQCGSMVTKYGDHMQTHLVDAIRGHCAQEMRQPGAAIHPHLRSAPDADDLHARLDDASYAVDTLPSLSHLHLFP